MRKPTAWALARVQRWGFSDEKFARMLALEIDHARECGKTDAIRVLNKAAQEFEQKGEEGVAFACRSVGKYLRAVA